MTDIIKIVDMLKQAREFMEQGHIKVLTPEIITQIIAELRSSLIVKH